MKYCHANVINHVGVTLLQENQIAMTVVKAVSSTYLHLTGKKTSIIPRLAGISAAGEHKKQVLNNSTSTSGTSKAC
ncbi:MAG TPA: hypothetical protein DEO70_06195 [Bacteroidales bacterium]|nr:MAG: hypothetical protein A2X11_08240 [Bacteroidetes bacterium GWE2_42_24]OFY31105.1 MAG: hypothetical protein A2X09_15535 [Bacteroidetes bacterium GWF2_43_11]HBZ66411.1 hypothetical protein [Bacteroidales bacterium]